MVLDSEEEFTFSSQKHTTSMMNGCILKSDVIQWKIQFLSYLFLLILVKILYNVRYVHILLVGLFRDYIVRHQISASILSEICRKVYVHVQHYKNHVFFLFFFLLWQY